MNLYNIVYASEAYWVEAPSLFVAVSLWREFVEEDMDEPFNEDPDTVTMVTDEPIIRSSTASAKAG